MKINRRGFISIGLGASAGLTFSPLPWKLLDDLSIWTQNWPWVPVPKDGKESFRRSSCSLCPGGCGITVRKIDERVVSIAGVAESPLNRGAICPLGLSGPQLLYTPVRIMSPMLRVKGKFQPVSWDEGISVLVSRLNEMKAAGRLQRLACLSGTDQGTVPFLIKKFLGACGSQRFFHMPTAEDTWEVLSEKLTGDPFVPGYDLENADTILSFGCGLVEGWGSPVRSMQANSLWKKQGARLVQIESRLSATAAVADRWIAVKPGTQADLALGICQVIANRYPENRRYLRNSIPDWQVFKNRLEREYSAAQTETKTGVPQDVIESLANEFARSKNPLAICGRDQGRTPGDSREFTAVFVLNLLAGNIDRKGGFYRIYRQAPARGSADETRQHAAKSGKPLRSGGLKMAPENLFREIAAAARSPVELLLVSDANPFYSLMNDQHVNEAFRKIPFVVSFSTHWDETAMNADLILPNHSHLERYQDFPVYSGLIQPRLVLVKPVVKPLLDTRHTGDVLIETARHMEGEFSRALPWKNYETCLKKSIGENWQSINENGFIDLPKQNGVNGRGSLKLDLEYIESSKIRLEGDPSVYPLILIPKVSMRVNSGAVGSTPFMVKSVDSSVLNQNWSVVDLHPATGRNLGVEDDDIVLLTTPAGSAEVKIHLDEGTMPETVVISQGFGHTALGDCLAGRGTNVNRLMTPVKDPVTGLNAAWGIRAKLSKG